MVVVQAVRKFIPVVPFSSSFIIIENNKLVIRYDKFSALSNVLGPVTEASYPLYTL